IITDLGNENLVAEAVGFVVCGAQFVYPDGSQGDFPATIGTAFMVSPEGHLLTNKHVVEEVWNLKNAKLLRKKMRDELLLEMTPAVWVFFGKHKYEAEILYVSDNHDLGILKIARQNVPYFR